MKRPSWTPLTVSVVCKTQVLILFIVNYNVVHLFQVRIIAVKPHSADVERLISYYNIIKTQMRSTLSHKTIQDSLYIKINVPFVPI